jgi:ferredoxin
MRAYRAFDKENLVLEGYDRIPRQKAGHAEGITSKETFKDLRDTFTEDQIKKETERCLSCGATVADEFLCVGCGSCTTKCKFDAIKLVRRYDSASVEYNDLKPLIIKNALKRKVRIVTKKPVRFIKSIFSSEKAK